MRRLWKPQPPVGIAQVSLYLTRVPDCSDASLRCVSFAVFLCLQCAGVHRGFGVHVRYVLCTSAEELDAIIGAVSCDPFQWTLGKGNKLSECRCVPSYPTSFQHPDGCIARR